MDNIIENKYKIIEKIGAGGTSVVYKAVDLATDKFVAIKVLRDELAENTQQVERFLRESRALNQLSHPNIVNIIDMGKFDENKDYIVMEYVDGMTLKEYIQQKKYLSFDEIVELATQMCDALDYAHYNGVIHRDIKPQNILLDSEGNARIADFGTARIVDQNTLTMAGRDVIGSVHYISPEQARGSVIDARSDIYSLGITIFEMATGSLPFVGDDAITIAMKHINQSPKRPKDLNVDIPKCLNDIILKCISKDPLKRYQSVYELSEDLLAAQKNPDAFSIYSQKYDVLPDDEAGGGTVANNKKSSRTKKKADAKRKNRQFVKNVITLVLIVLLLIGGLTALFIYLFKDDGPEISAGTVKVENLVGKSFDEAVAWARQNNLRTPEIPEYIYTDDVPEGQVMEQSIVAGTVVKTHDQIFFKVSGGPEKVKVPLLKNLSEEDAIEALNKLELEIGEIHYENTEEYFALKVFKQSIEADTKVLKGTKVDIWIAKSSLLKKRVPNLIGSTESAARIKLEELNFSFGGIEYEYSASYAEGKIVRTEPSANLEFEYDANVPVKIFISKGPAMNYNGYVEIPIPEITGPTDIKILFLDEAGNEIIVCDEQVDETSYNSFAENGIWSINETSQFYAPRVYVLYINGEEFGRYDMMFTDGYGNPVVSDAISSENP